jgi:hypothetical protein
MPLDDVMTPDSEVSLGTSQDLTPEPGAAQAEQKPDQAAPSTAGGDTPVAAEPAEPMIPKSRFDSVKQRLDQAEAISNRLSGIASRFGRDSGQYLEELERFYEKQNQTPKSVEEKLEELTNWRNQTEQQKIIDREVANIKREMDSVRDNQKYSILKGNWEKWSKIILGSLQAEPSRTVESVAQELVDILNAHQSSYIKAKTEEGRRQIGPAGSGSPPIRKNPNEKVTLRDFDKVISSAVKGERALQKD